MTTTKDSAQVTAPTLAPGDATCGSCGRPAETWTREGGGYVYRCGGHLVEGARPLPVPATLDCDHCGDVAVRGLFSEDMASECGSCGFPGHVIVDPDDGDRDDGGDGGTVYWSASDEDDATCKRAGCEECRPPPVDVEVLDDTLEFPEVRRIMSSKPGHTTHHAGCACWEAKRNAETATLRAERDEADRRRSMMGNDLRQALTDRAEAIANCRVAHAAPGDVWMWESDGENHADSLSCPVVMSAETLRGILAERDTAVARLGEVERAARELIDMAATLGHGPYVVPRRIVDALTPALSPRPSGEPEGGGA